MTYSTLTEWTGTHPTDSVPDLAKLIYCGLDSGRFESVSKPYAFHTVMRSMLVPLRLAADARGLELISEFDPAIDETIRKANRSDEVKRGLLEHGASEKGDGEEEEAIVLGDEVGIFVAKPEYMRACSHWI
jgi:hypothetical protein